MTTTTTPDSVSPGISQARQRYTMLLTTLNNEDVRTERATILTAMREVAVTLARLTRGTTSQDDLINGDTLAWDDTASLLERLADAENGKTGDLETGDDTTDIDDYDEWDAWSQVANALTFGDRATALDELSGFLLAPLPEYRQIASWNHWPTSVEAYLWQPGNVLRTRPFAYARFTEAADACTAGYPAAYQTEGDYRARITAQAAG